MAPSGCARVRKALSAYIDGELNPRARLFVRQHLEECPSCASEMEALRATSASLRRLPEPELPEGFHAALARKVAAEGSAARAGEAEGGRSNRRAPSRLTGDGAGFWSDLGSRLRRFPLRGAAVVAGLVVLVLWAGSFAFFMGLPVPGSDLLGLRRSGAPESLGGGSEISSADASHQGGSAAGAGNTAWEGAAPGAADKSTGLAGMFGDATGGGGTGSAGGLVLGSTAGRQVILNVNLSIECEKVSQARDRAVSAVESAGGFVESLNYWTDGEGLVSASMALRVPSVSLTGVLEQIRALGTVLGEQASRTDVTAQHVDLTARINNLSRQEQSLLTLLGKAENLGDIFAIQSELARIRTEIENYQSQLRSLDEQVSLSTIYLSLQPVGAGPGPESGLWERITDAFLKSLAWLVSGGERLLIFLAAVLVPLAVFAGLGWLGWRALQIRRRRAGV